MASMGRVDMRFLSVAERELRAAARQKGTYRLRWITATGALALLLWLAWALDLFSNRRAVPLVFQACSTIIFLYCLIIGAAETADCISREKREGTLGLLFLTNLNSAEIVAGKLCSKALVLIYPLLAMLPILALPVLIGGISLGHFWRAALALANAIFFAMAAGFTASAVSVRQIPSVALATGLALLFGMGPSGVAALIRIWGSPAVADIVAAFCPFRSLTTAGNSPPRLGDYWLSLAVVAAMSWTSLALVAWRVGRMWRDRAKGARRWSRVGFGERLRNGAGRAAFRRRLLEINPLYWLAGRQRVSAPIFMVLTVGLVCITAWLTAPFLGRVIRAGLVSPLAGHLFAWFWAGLAIHAMVLYYGATAAAERLAEDKQSGALELILSTPTTLGSISRGLWMGYGRRMLFPVLIALLIHSFFVWQVLTLIVLEPPGKLPAQFTPWQLFWSALCDQSLNGLYLDWEAVFVVRALLLSLVILATTWVMLGWLGRWLGLRLKHSGLAPIASVFLALVPPVLLFSLACFCADRWHLTRMPERQWVPLMMWIGFGIGMGNCFLLSRWASARLRRDFRTAVTSHYQPPPPRRSWIPSRRVWVRFATATAAFALALVLTVVLFYSYQNWRSQRRWAAFQKELYQRGESLDLSSVLAGPVPAAQNFAQSPAFQNLLPRAPAAHSGASLLERSPDSSVQAWYGSNTRTPWIKQDFADLDEALKWIDPGFSPGKVKDRKSSAAAVSDGLKPLQEAMAAVALAARLPFFQMATNRDPAAVLQSNSRELATMQRLHFVFHLRASALLALDRQTEAGEDVLTSLRLARLARQSPDANSSSRAQFLLACSLQPLWEGLVEHHWNEAQLAAFQKELARFDLLSDHTNAIHRIVLAYVETWRAQPEGKAQPRNGPEVGGVYVRQGGWMPRAWWYDHCVRLYRAGRNAIARVDVAAGRMSNDVDWRDLAGLPLDSNLSPIFQQASWWGSSPMLVSFAQTSVNQAVIACALERYRLAHATYPETLDPLVPAYLDSVPRDIGRGRPMFYRREDKDNYVLRGAGPNGTIDSGKGPSDDWLWSSSASATNAPAGAIQRK